MAKAKPNQKLDLILEQLPVMSQKIDSMHTSMSAITEELGSLSFTVNNHEDRLTALERDMRTQKELSNTQQQQLRSLTVRLLNVPYSPGETLNNFAKLRDNVYSRFLLPLLTAAKNKNEISVIPPSNAIIDSCFRPYSPSNSNSDQPPPPVIIKISSKPLKIVVMKNKKELPKPTTDENTIGITRFILVEDLTPDNHRVLATLSKSKLTHKVWSVDGRIKFTKVDKPEVVMTVKSVYDPLTKILSD